MARVPDKAIVVFDEAYVEFAQGPDFPDTLDYLRHGTEGRRPAHVLEGGEPGRAARGLRHGRPELHRAAEPHPAAVQRQLARPGRRARRPRGRRPRARVPAHDRGRPALPLRRVHRARAQVRALARQLHPRGRGPERHQRLPVAPQGRRDRPADDELRDGERAARDHRHARRRTGASSRRSRKCWPGSRTRDPSPHPGRARPPGRLGGQGRSRRTGSPARSSAVGRRPSASEPALAATARSTASRTDIAEGVAGADFVSCSPRRWPRSPSCFPPCGVPRPPTR